MSTTQGGRAWQIFAIEGWQLRSLQSSFDDVDTSPAAKEHVASFPPNVGFTLGMTCCTFLGGFFEIKAEKNMK